MVEWTYRLSLSLSSVATLPGRRRNWHVADSRFAFFLPHLAAAASSQDLRDCYLLFPSIAASVRDDLAFLTALGGDAAFLRCRKPWIGAPDIFENRRSIGTARVSTRSTKPEARSPPTSVVWTSAWCLGSAPVLALRVRGLELIDRKCLLGGIQHALEETWQAASCFLFVFVCFCFLRFPCIAIHVATLGANAGVCSARAWRIAPRTFPKGKLILGYRQ